VIRTHGAGKRALVIGLLVAAVACGSAAAATIPPFWLNLHARLAPVAGTTATGRFTGTLHVTGRDPTPEPSDNLPPLGQSLLTWHLKPPALHGSMSASLRLRTTNSAPPLTRMLCMRCSTTASGKMTLTTAQGLRIAQSGAVVVVRTHTATLRGPVKVSARIVAQ
jgi:hypothetical protein